MPVQRGFARFLRDGAATNFSRRKCPLKTRLGVFLSLYGRLSWVFRRFCQQPLLRLSLPPKELRAGFGQRRVVFQPVRLRVDRFQFVLGCVLTRWEFVLSSTGCPASAGHMAGVCVSEHWSLMSSDLCGSPALSHIVSLALSQGSASALSLGEGSLADS